jgi:hypothetical protein
METTRPLYTSIAPIDVAQKTAFELKANGFEPILLETGKDAFEKIQELIPAGASVMNGSSTTLNQIGFVEYLKSDSHGWRNLHGEILKESDKEKQAKMRKLSVISDYYLGSAHAVTEEGEIVIASNTGSQMPHLVYTSPNIILVVGRQKIVSNLAGAFDRIKSHVVPLEDERMKGVYGFGTTYAKTLILHQENPNMGRNIKVLLVNEQLGF